MTTARLAVLEHTATSSDRLVRVVVAVASLGLVASFLGFVSSMAVDIGLGRTGPFVADIQRPLMVWGVMSLATPLLRIGGWLLGLAVLAVAASTLLDRAPALQGAIGGPVSRAARRGASIVTQRMPPSHLVLAWQVLLLVLFYAAFQDVIQSVAHFGHPGLPGSLDALRPSQGAVHERYRLASALLVAGLVTPWVALNRRRRRREDVVDGAVAGGLLAMLAGVCLFALPFRVLEHDASERVTLGGHTCYLVARDRQAQGRLFCPAAPPADRLRTVWLGDPGLVRSGIVESVFSELDRARPRVPTREAVSGPGDRSPAS